MRTYGGRLINSKVRREITNRQELRDAIVWDVYPVDKYCRVKIQGTDKYVKAHYNENWGSTPEWLKPGNAVRISHPGGNKGRIEVVGHGILIPTAIPGGSVTPPTAPLTDAVLTGMAVMAPSDGGMTAWVYTGTYRIDGTTYSFSGMTMDNATIEMDRPDLFIDEVGGSVSFEAAHATLFRYDLVVVGTDGVLDVVKGSNYSGEPTFPAVPADHVQCGWALIYPGMTSITQFDISNYYSGAQEETLSVVLSDNDLSWGQHNFTITISFVDQYHREVEGDYHCTIKIMPFGTGDLYADTGAATSGFLPSSVSDPTPGVKAWAVNFTDHATITYTREDDTTGEPPVATYSESSGYIVVEETTTESIEMKEYTLRDALGNVLQNYGTSV